MINFKTTINRRAETSRADACRNRWEWFLMLLRLPVRTHDGAGVAARPPSVSVFQSVFVCICF